VTQKMVYCLGGEGRIELAGPVRMHGLPPHSLSSDPLAMEGTPKSGSPGPLPTDSVLGLPRSTLL